MDKPNETNLFIMWSDETCKECRRGISQLAKLASLTKDSSEMPKIGIIDCEKSKALCSTFHADSLPYMLLLKNKNVFRYQGEIDANKIYNDFLSNNTYREHLVSDNLILFVVEGE